MSGKRRIPKLFVVTVTAAALLTACGPALSSSSDTGSVPSDSPAQAAESSDTVRAADFQIAIYNGGGVVEGQEVSLSVLLDQGKPVVLNLWAGLCPPCRLEMPEFERVSAEFGDEIILFGLDVGPFTNLGTSQDGQALVQELGVTYPTGTTDDAKVVAEYRLLGMPTTYFIKPDGEIIRQWTGVLTEAKLAELVDELIQASVGS